MLNHCMQLYDQILIIRNISSRGDLCTCEVQRIVMLEESEAMAGMAILEEVGGSYHKISLKAPERVLCCQFLPLAEIT